MVTATAPWNSIDRSLTHSRKSRRSPLAISASLASRSSQVAFSVSHIGRVSAARTARPLVRASCRQERMLAGLSGLRAM